MLMLLDANNAEQSWSSAPGGIGPLRPNTNCKGAAAFHSNNYVLDNGKVRTTFEVGNQRQRARRYRLLPPRFLPLNY